MSKSEFFADSHVIPVYGIPGSGKTTYLLGVLDKLFRRGVKPYEVAFVSYTTTACEEARDRARKKFDLKRKDFAYFQTIHALSKQTTESQRGTKLQVLDTADLRELGDRLALPVRRDYSENRLKDTGGAPAGKGDYILGLLTFAHARQVDVSTLLSNFRTQQDMHRMKVSPGHIWAFENGLADLKEETGKIDFIDMLNHGMTCDPLDCKFVIIDEAQDLSLAQWNVCNNIFRFAENVWIAGDDDQAIFDFSGGTSEVFRHMGTLPSTVKLERSWRCPRRVLQAAQSPLRMLSDRVPKEAVPRDEPGTVEYTGLHNINFDEGNWLCLVRQHSHAEQFAEFFQSRGYAFIHSSGSPAIRNSWRKLIELHQKVVNGRTLKPLEVAAYYKQLTVGQTVKRGYKTNIEQRLNSAKKTEVTAAELIESFGMLPDVLDMTWFDALDAIPIEKRKYIRNTIKNGDFKLKEPRIRISTMHGAKGTECDNVVINPVLGYRQERSLLEGDETEYRVAYVAMTRARQALYILRDVHGFTVYNRPTSGALDEEQAT